MPKLLGVDIDTGKLRMAAAELRFRTVRHLKTVDVPLPGEKEERTAALSEAFLQWKKEFAPDGIVIGLPLQYFSCTPIDMPLMARDDLRRALRFELEKHLPLPVDEYEFDFLMAKGQNGFRTLVFSVRKEIIDSLHKVVTDAGLQLVSVRCRTIDLMNSMAALSTEKQMKGIFVHAADDDYELAALDDAGIVYMKRIPGQRDLVEELERSLQQYPGKVYASGDFEQRTLDRFAVQKTQISPPYASLASYAGKKGFSLEFIPPELRRQRKDYYPYAIAGCAVSAIAFVLLTGFVTYFKDAYTLNRIESQTNAIKAKASGVIETRKKLDEMLDARKEMVAFLDRSNLAIKAIRDISRAVPADTWVINLSADDKGNVEMEGFSRKTSDLVLALEKDGIFKSIAFAAPIISREGEERFSLKLEVKDK